MSSSATGGLSLSLMRQFEDSDDEEDDDDDDNSSMTLDDNLDSGMTQVPSMSQEMPAEGTRPPSTETAMSDPLGSWTTVVSTNDESADPDEYAGRQRNVRAKFSHPSTPRARDMDIEQEDGVNKPTNVESQPVHSAQSHAYPDIASGASPTPISSRKMQIVIRDVAYATYRAVLYYVSLSVPIFVNHSDRCPRQIYTDTIIFAPLSSSFFTNSATTPQPSTSPSTPTITASESQHALSLGPRSNQQQEVSGAAFGSSPSSAAPVTRREWIAQWERNNPGKPRPSSAKAVYRLADSKCKYDHMVGGGYITNNNIMCTRIRSAGA